jgi:hypothetical protein
MISNQLIYVLTCATTVRVLGATDTRWCDIQGSLRHMATNNIDWLLEQIDSRRFKHRIRGFARFGRVANEVGLTWLTTRRW